MKQVVFFLLLAVLYLHTPKQYKGTYFYILLVCTYTNIKINNGCEGGIRQ